MGNHVVVGTAGYELEVTRVANIIADADDEGQYIQVAKVVDHAWLVRKPPSLSSSNEGREMT